MISPHVLVGAVPSLRALSAGALTRLAAAASERRFAARAVLFREGQPASALFFVLEGRVRVVRGAGARMQVLHHEGAGGVLGEIPVFGGGPYPATALAVSATRCAVVSAAALERLLRETPELALFALRRMSARARGLLQRLDELTASTVTARVAAYLLARAEVAGPRAFTLGMPQSALAEELGTAREVVVRSLRRLCDSGALRRAGRARFTIARAELLTAFSRP